MHIGVVVTSAKQLTEVQWIFDMCNELQTVRCIVLQSRWCESESNNVWWAPFQWTQYVWCVLTQKCVEWVNPIMWLGPLYVRPITCGVMIECTIPIMCGTVRVHIPNNVAEPLSWQALKSLSPHCLIFGFHALMNCTLASQRHTGTLITVHWAYKGLRAKSDLK